MTLHRIIWCCSDLHNGPAGDPRTDSTPGWAREWAPVPEGKLRLGDMSELLQFTRAELDAAGAFVATDVDGNHDRGSCGRRVIRMGDTIFLHGDQFDSRVVRWIGRPVSWLVGRAEFLWPDVDERLEGWFSRTFKSGRHGHAATYVRKAAAYAKRRGARQIVFGHLHDQFRVESNGVQVVCTGCCCGGRLDFVPVEVRFERGQEV
jgi:hypothetical protein